VKKRIPAPVLCILAVLLLSLAGAVLYFALDWQIPPDQKLVRLYTRDVFHGTHTVLGDGARAVPVTVSGIRETDTVGKRTLYAYTSAEGDGSFWYPGTPKGQVYGYPRLQRGERLVMIADAVGEKQRSFWLFRIREIEGEEFVYPLLYDDSIIPLTVLGESLPFISDEERSIYDPWYDEDVFKNLAKTGRTAPAYSYKTTLLNLTQNVGKLTRSGGR